MDELESELDNPTGVTTARAPPLVLDGVLISKNCGILLEAREAKGLKYVLTFTKRFLVFSFFPFFPLGFRGFGGRPPHVN